MDIGVPYSVTQRGFYGRSINPRTAFDQGVLEATGGQGFTRDAVGDVKRTYEQKLANYLKQLPGDPDFSGIPQKYRNTFLLLNKPPKYPGSANGNMQIVSTLNGARFAEKQGAQYILKKNTEKP